MFALICYYVYVAYKYFSWEILAVIGIKRIDEKNEAVPVAEIKKQFTSGNHADFLPKELLNEVKGILQLFWDEVNAYLAEIRAQAPKEEICFAVKVILEKYPVLITAENKIEVETTISGLLNQYFPERFTVADMQTIWH
ncbi:MAG: hypothetical protein HYR66_07375 [Sphingobacteriales bacterium]|nr:hypothetical protein [Sphingobacteriales bacterium]MBI3718567.1 hypothetical protein [Sphingobacteriales bacterium]